MHVWLYVASYALLPLSAAFDVSEANTFTSGGEDICSSCKLEFLHY